MKVGPRADRGVDPDSTPLHLDDLAGNRKAQSGADDLAAGLLVALVTAEEALDKFGRYPDAVVTRLVTSITPPSGEYLTALVSRLEMICVRRSASQCTIGSVESKSVAN